MNKVLLALVFCFALLSAPFVARAEEEEVDVDVNEIEVEEDAEDDIDEAELAARYAAAYGQQQAQQGGSQQMFLTSSPDVETTYVFPEFMDQKIPAGAVVDALCGFQNTGVETFSVQYMRAFLVSPQNWNHHIQNYTTFRYNVSVPAGEESSILYRFRPDAYLEPREYGLKMEVFYVAPNNETFVSTFFNGTITVVEPPANFDSKTAFTYAALVAIVALGGFGVYKAIPNKRRGKTTRTEASTSDSSAIRSEWVSAEHLKSARVRRTPSKEKKIKLNCIKK
eukprot:TRINITY_DN527_c0_g1_i2.p1 TRINITY_DN527_c0_g1~~TRINITY_DN527_c0_g1_i2.p1  ORF type:complete len:317 (+),score=152.37 TRINITY_DN527_c0_g1_i2:109-951(+)